MQEEREAEEEEGHKEEGQRGETCQSKKTQKDCKFMKLSHFEVFFPLCWLNFFLFADFSKSPFLLVSSLFVPIIQDSDVERDSDRERDYGENSDSVASDYGSGEKKKKKKHKERKEKKTKKKKKDDGDRDSSQEETTKVKRFFKEALSLNTH